MPRETHTWFGVEAGCAVCGDGEGRWPIWTKKNAQMLAARHHDATGHRTWARQTLDVSYGGKHSGETARD